MAGRLTLMTWNVRYFGHSTRGARATAAGLKRIAGAIAGLDPTPDVIALQEVEHRSLRGGLDTQPQIQRFADALHDALAARGVERRYHPVYFAAHRYELRGVPPLYTTGLAVLVADHVELEHHNAELPHDITHIRVPRFAGFKQRRIAAHVRLRPRGATRSLDLFNTHLSLPAFFHQGFHLHRIAQRMGHGINQLREIEALLRLVDDHAAGDHAVIVGDLNSAPESPTYDALTGAGWVDAYADHHDLAPRDLHATGTARFMHLRMHIDHVFSTPSVRWLDLHAHGIDDDGPFLGLSDHSPKLGTLQL